MLDDFISLLPFYSTPASFLLGDGLPCSAAKIEDTPIENILLKLKRKAWAEGLYVKKNDLSRIKRYKDSNGHYMNDFNEKQFLQWVRTIEDNTAICEMENKHVGKGVFVPPEKKLPKGTFIPSSGMIKLDPTKEELETKNHCSALQDLNSPERKIYGFIDPEVKGGILDLINHAPNEEEIANFKFKNPSVRENAATSNLNSTIKFYNGYAIMGVEAFQDINGGKNGKQLLWSYAQLDEYFPDKPFNLDNPTLLLFDNRDEYNGKIINPDNYSLRKIDIFIDTGDTILRKVASLTRWELMEADPKLSFTFSIKDPYSTIQSEVMPSSIFNGFLQTYLKQNPAADRIILLAPEF